MACLYNVRPAGDPTAEAARGSIMKRSNLLLLLVSLASASAAACVIEVSDSGLRFDGFDFGGVSVNEKAQRTETHALALAPGETLTLDTSYGDIEVAAAGEGAPELRATLHASGRTVAEAEAVLARYQVVLERGPNGPSARLVGEPLRVHEGGTRLVLAAHVDYSATVPTGTPLCATTESGDIRTSGELGRCHLDTEYGAIALDAARGDVSARSGSGDVSAERVEGGRIELASEYGDVRLRAARAERLSCKTGSGDVALEDAEAGTLELSTDYGNVHAKKTAGELCAHSGSGDVRLHGVRGAITADSDYGTVEVEGELTGLSATSGSGDVRVRAEGKSRTDAGWKLASDYGSVLLRAPEGFGCVLDAKTDYGSVECDFPITIEAGKKKGEGKLKGTVGSGGGTVKLSSGSGDVALKKY